MNARSEQLNEQIQKSRKSGRRGLHQLDQLDDDGPSQGLDLPKRQIILENHHYPR